MFQYLVETGEKNIPLEEAFLSAQVLGGIKKTACLLNRLHSVRLNLMDTAEISLYRHTKNCRYLTDGEKSIVCDMIDTLPKGNCVCHGDPNPGNIIDDGKNTYFIDWMNCVTGNLMYDLAEYVLMMKYAVLPLTTPTRILNFIDGFKDLIADTFLSEYQKISNFDRGKLDEWMIPLSVSKLHSNRPEDEKLIILSDIRKKL